MGVDKRTTTARARREMINKHLYRDHGKLMPVQGESVEDRYRKHRELHEAGGCDHDHVSYDDLRAECGSYVGEKPLRVRTDRPPTKFTITWHLASDHQDRVLGDRLAKEMHHANLHLNGIDGEWAGEPLHRHTDLDDLAGSLEYKGDS